MTSKLRDLERRLQDLSWTLGVKRSKYGGDMDSVRVAMKFSEVFMDIFGGQLGLDAEYEFYYWARANHLTCPPVEGIDFHWRKRKGENGQMVWKKIKIKIAPRPYTSRCYTGVPFEWILKAAMNAVCPLRVPVVRRTPVHVLPRKKRVTVHF